MQVVNIAQKLDLFQEFWRPHIVGEVNDTQLNTDNL